MTARPSRYIHGFYEEPFRIFFPAGIVLGIVGVTLWPAYFFGLVATYPGTAHSRLMIEGFMASFIIGFLGTAGPRITSTSPFSQLEVMLLLTLNLFSAGLHFGESHGAGDLLFVVCLAGFILVIGKRFVRRADSPPPNFVLVGLGLLNGLVGAVLVASSENAIASARYRIGATILEQGFVLLPILGIAPFLLPRLLNTATPNELPESRKLPPGWLPQAGFALVIGLTIDGTFVADTLKPNPISGWLRLGAVLLYLMLRMPWRGRSFLGNYLRAGLAAIVIGIAIEQIWPLTRLGALHIIFVAGFSFIVLTVAIRVVFGHSGRGDLLRRPLPFFRVVALLVLFAAVSRYVTEIAPKVRTMHLVGAAIAWLIAAFIWSAFVIPKTGVIGEEK